MEAFIFQNMAVPNCSAPLVSQRPIRELAEPRPRRHDVSPIVPSHPHGYPSQQPQQYPTMQRGKEYRVEKGELRMLVCDYINHLIEENEQLTQISRAYTVPTPLDFENEHYFEEVRNTDHPFPSDKFRAWLETKKYESCQNFNNYFPPPDVSEMRQPIKAETMLGNAS